MKVRQLLPAAPGFRAAYVLDDDPSDVGLVPVVAWAVLDDAENAVVAMVLDTEEGALGAAKDVCVPGCRSFVCVLGPDDQERDVRAQVQQEHEAETRKEEGEESEEDAKKLSSLGFDVTPHEARVARDFLGGIHIGHHGKMNDDDREKLEAILHAARLRFPRTQRQ
jgi:hypothetical protein